MSNKNITIPKYSLSEELISSISHGVGALLGIAALVLCVIRGAFNGSAIQVVSCSIYGGTLIVLYTMSCLYHALKVNLAKKVFRIIDHCSIYLLIAGTYTPYTLVSLNGALGWTMFGIVWGCAVIGVVLNAIDLMGIKEVFCKDDNLKDILKALKFKNAGNKYVLNLNGYFNAGC